MQYVLTLIAKPQSNGLTTDVIRSATSTLTAMGASLGALDVLAADEACDIAFDGVSLDEVDHRVSGLELPVDAVTQARAGRRKTLLIADMDSTIVRGETLDELADFAGVKDRVAAITARAMNGELDFEAAVDERVGLLAGMPVTTLDEAWKRIDYNDGARELVATMNHHGAVTALVSGGFDFFTRAVREELGFDFDQANVLLQEGHVLTGKVRKPILDRQAKVDALHRLVIEHNLNVSNTMAVGDGANDLQMLSAAGTGVAFHAKPTVQAQARVRINHGDLTALLFLQGYRRSEFTSVC